MSVLFGRRSTRVLLSVLSGALLGCSAEASNDDGPEGGVSPSEASADGAVNDTVDGGSSADASEEMDGSHPFDAAEPVIACATEPCIVQIASGAAHICALTSHGEVYCWGDNALGEVGPAPVRDETDAAYQPEIVARPRRVLSGARTIAAGDRSTCAVLDSGEVQCWGGAGNITCDPSPVPRTVEGLPRLVSLAVTMSSACGTSEDHDVWCWGANVAGILARSDVPILKRTCSDDVTYVPAGKADLIPIKTPRIAIFQEGAYAIDESGQLWSWGSQGVLGRPASLPYDGIPFAVPEMAKASSVSTFAGSRGSRVCAVSDAKVYCWGARQYAPWAIPIPEGEYATQVAVGNHACIRTASGAAYCWGANQWGQLGDGSGIDQPLLPVLVKDIPDKVAKVVATDIATCALLVSGQVTCWGGNLSGQLGQGSVGPYPYPHPQVVTFP